MTWNDQRIEQLKTLWADGRSASAIAAELGSVTRNAVIGNFRRFQNCSFLGEIAAFKATNLPVERRFGPL